ncbi:MAG TPA: type II toxin-antitoxin system VapC family toxin [Candidatus Binatus sp.]|jgi:PIN domain nuclease of toxin-antitoxin system|nr:type II toxin-antitoxin system VapC family toxin [Candidatus Binatus sp.]
MKVLIDTHVLLWGLQDEAKLSKRVRDLLPVAEVWISVASLWEIITKVQVGKLDLPGPVGDYLSAKLKANGVSVLPLVFDHVRRLEELPLHHRDPFDRILIAQSLEEKLPLVSGDPQFQKYSIRLIW